MTGVYITGHPMMEYEKYMEQYPVNLLTILESREEGLSLDGKEVTLPCIIQSRRNRTTKTNRLMANLVIEDLYAQMNAMVFLSLIHILMPVRPGRNLAVVVEATAMDYRVKSAGFNIEEEINRRLETP